MFYSTGALLGLNRYDEFGQPQSTNLGAFGYTGQAWLPTVGVYYYKARMYEPELGRFLQPDPIGYWDSANLYAYVLNDPVNFTDPFGLQSGPDIVVSHPRCPRGWSCTPGGGAGGGGGGQPPLLSPVVQRQIDYSVRPIPDVKWKKRKISQCMAAFLKQHAGSSYDRSQVVITNRPPLPFQAASTGPNIIYAGTRYSGFEKGTSLFFHELAHMPQWASGELTLSSYALDAVKSFFAFGHGLNESIHRSIPVEAEAIAFARDMLAAYKEADRPCDK